MEQFFDAFSKLNCSEKIKREYEDVLVEKNSASQSKKLVFVYCKKHQLLSYGKIRAMEKELYRQVFKKLGFRPQLRLSYPELRGLPLETLLSSVEDDLKQEIRELDLVDGLEFCAEPFEVEGESLYITCGDSFLTRKRCDGIYATAGYICKREGEGGKAGSVASGRGERRKSRRDVCQSVR